MRIKFYSQEKLKKELLEIIGQYLDLDKNKIFFFGSRVAGKKDERADIDLGIEGPSPISLEVMAQIKEKIENLPTLYSIDMVDFQRTEKDFQKVAKKNIELINP
ncbi:MAG: hypothetical protein COX44_02510 [Candidatus Portnoybacteria bacterium CG23_combo_of_CG06-09_8_20_14_all_37_13]|uniref:Polymerase beta nucleotidyltransferase domain-containing protein n=1 Tax=Candidatus Portnoybacteria bacterium CG23_combo_of_CG06-09_8_20_14_all_37_13 TaxID=1974819 RepID=A0A2G9YCK8_9BACT|nr:MAG: hypothetical protein COX44_02510 [Candidatus Portnoybacteria bacterium CG23_combo_of_CG06-09_8_20_14_all_37_13]